MFHLEEITTKDGFIHQGIVAYPKKSSDTALVWVHGLTGDFYSSTTLLRLLALQSVKHHIAFASFNTRGHNMVAGVRIADAKEKKGYRHGLSGASYERFEESVQDIDAVIEFFSSKKYKKIFLLGHSTGASKVCFYAGRKKDPRVSGVMLAAPMSDRLDPSQDKKTIEKNIVFMKKEIEKGKGEKLYEGYTFFPVTPRRYIQLMSEDSVENQFGYGENPVHMPEFEKISMPLLVLFAGEDEYAHQSIEDIKNVFDEKNRSKKYKSKIIQNALHSFGGKEEEFVGEVLTFVLIN